MDNFGFDLVSVPPRSVVVIHAEPETWEAIGQAIAGFTDPTFRDVPVLFLQPEETFHVWAEQHLNALGWAKK